MSSLWVLPQNDDGSLNGSDIVPLGGRDKRDNQPITSCLAATRWKAENCLKLTARDWHVHVSILPVAAHLWNETELVTNAISVSGQCD